MNDLNAPATLAQALKIIQENLDNRVRGMEFDMPVNYWNSKPADQILKATSLRFHPCDDSLPNLGLVEQAIDVVKASNAIISVYVKTQYADPNADRGFKPEHEFALLTLSNSLLLGKPREISSAMPDASSLEVFITPRRDDPEYAKANLILSQLYRQYKLGITLVCSGVTEDMNYLLRKRGL